MTSQGQRLPGQLVGAFQRLHQATLPTQQFGRLYINLSAILGQQQLSPVELQNVIKNLLKQGLGQLLQQSVAASGDEQRLPTSATTATADTGPQSLLPWHTLDLSNQPLGPDGAIKLFQVLEETSNRLRSLVLANSSIKKIFTGDILHVCKNSNECRVPQWFSHLQWLDLSHNPQLQLLGGDELDLLHLLDFLDVCQQLQGLCLQHTGLSTYQLGRLLDLMHMLLTLDDRSSCEQPESGFKPALSMLQCLKLGPIVQGQDNNSAATTAAADDAPTDGSSGWPEAAFQDVLSRLRMSSPPMNQLVVLELHGLHEQQQQQLNRYVAEVCSMLAQHPERHQQVMHNPLADRQPHLTSTVPGCCRLSWLKPGIILEFEQPVVGLEWEPPPPKPPKPTQTPAETGGIQMQQAAAPFFLPAPAAADAQTPAMGWTRQAGHTRQPPQQQQQQRPEQHTTVRQQPATTPGRPRLATPHHGSARPRSSVTAAAAAARTVRQASGIKRQQQQQQQGSRPRPATHQQYNQQQPSITDYTVPGARVPPMDNLDPLNAIADNADVGDFVLNCSRQQRRQQQQQRMARAWCHPPDRDADHGHYIGSQDTEPGAAVVDDGDDSDCHAPGLLAKLLQEHDSLYPDSDRSSSLLTHDDQDDAFTGRSNQGTISNGRGQQQQGQQRPKEVKRKRRRTLQAIPLGDDYAAPASRRGQQALPPLESLLSPIGALPGSWQDPPSPDKVSAGTDGDDGRHRDHDDDDDDDDGDDDDDADQQQTSEQDDLFIAGDDDDDLEHGMYSQERMRRDGSQQGGDGGGNGDETQRRRKKHRAGSSVGFGDDYDDDDDDVEGLRAFAHERSKLPGQGFGRKGQQLFGRVEDGAKRRPKTVSDGVQSALQRLEQQRARRMTNAVDEDSEDSQQQQQSGLRSRQQISSAAGETKKRRKSQHTVHKFLDVAAAGGSSPGYRRIEVHASDDDDLGDDDDLHLGGNDEHDDSSDSDPDTGKSIVRRGPAQRATEHHSHLPRPSSAAAAAPTVAAAAGVVDQQTPAGNQRGGRGGLDEPADEPHKLPTAAAAAGGGGGGAGGGSRVKRRSLVAVVESESQDELDLLLQQFQQERLQQQQQLRTREQQEPADGVQVTASAFGKGATPWAPSGACTSIGKHKDAQELQQQQHLQDTPAPEQQRRRRERSSMQRLGSLTPPMPAAGPGTPAVPSAADTAVKDGHDGAVGRNGSAAESDEESSDDIDELPEIQKLREEEKRLQKLKVLEEQLKQQLEAALAAAASTSGAARPAAAGNAQPTVAHDPTEDNAPAAAGASPVAATNPSHTTAAAAAPAGCPQSAVVNSSIEVLAQQLCETKDKRLMVYRLVKELRNSVPFNWDKRGVEARSLRQMNQPQASKRQSRAPERLSPGAIEQQGKLLRQTRQRQQQQQQQQPGDPVFAVPPAAAGARQAALVGSRRQTKYRKSRGDQEDIGSSSSSSESDSDDDDDQPIAVLLRRARAATATSAAGPQRQVPAVDHGVAIPNGGKEGTCDVIATGEDSAVAAAAAGESLDSKALHAADGAADDAPAADLDEHVAGAETGMMPEQEGILVESTAAQTQTPQQVRPLIDVTAAAGLLAESAASNAGQGPSKTVGAVTNGQSSIVAVDAAHQDEQAVAGVPAGQAAAATTLVDDQAATTGVHGFSGLFAAALRSPWLEASDVGMAALQRDPAARQGPMDPPGDDFSPTPQQQQSVGDVVDVTATTAPTVQASAQQLTGVTTADKLVAGPPATAPAADTVQQQQQVPDLLAINAVPAEEKVLAAATAPLPLQLAPQATAFTEFVGAAAPTDECKAEGRVAAAPNCIQGDASAAHATPVSAAPEAPVRDALQVNNKTGMGFAPAADSLLAEEAGAAEGRVVAVPLYTATAAAGAAESVPGPVVAAATPPKVATTAVASAAQEIHAAVPKSVDQGLELEAAVAQTVGTKYTGAPQVPDTVVQPQTSQFGVGDEVELVIPDSEEE